MKVAEGEGREGNTCPNYGGQSGESVFAWILGLKGYKTVKLCLC